MFNARAFDLVDVNQAKASFKEFAEEIGRLGKKTVKYEGLRSSRPTCQVAYSGKMPCDLLAFPSKEMACQLANRAKKLFLHVRMSCNDSWIKFYGNVRKKSVLPAFQIKNSDYRFTFGSCKAKFGKLPGARRAHGQEQATRVH